MSIPLEPRPPVPMPPPAPVENFVELGRIPDFLKDLRSFNGNPTELMNWILDVEGIFQMYHYIPKNSLQYDLIEKSVRRRIVGEAADVLNANNITADWAEIKSTLLLYYSDKRELKTLDFELTTIKKGQTESLSVYYSRVNELLAAIIAQVQTDKKYSANAPIFIDYFREKALDSFIRGHERNLSLLLKTAQPKTLSGAYQFCLDYNNMDMRSGPPRNDTPNVSLPKPRGLEMPKYPPRPPPRIVPRPPMNPPPQPLPRRIFNHNPQFHNPQFPNSFVQRNQSRPEPMDVDPSIRSRNVNYGNRPQFNIKRPHPPSQQVQNFKRVAHPLEFDPINYEYYDYYQDISYHYPDEEILYYDNTSQNDDFYEPNTYANPEENPEPSTSTQIQPNNEPTANPNVGSTAHFLEWKTSW